VRRTLNITEQSSKENVCEAATKLVTVEDIGSAEELER
jgi:hypothetical protein